MSRKKSDANKQTPRSAPALPSRSDLVAVGFVFVVVALWIYSPAFHGDFISDDGHYVSENPYVHDLTLAHLAAILNPFSVVARLVENYAPVHLLLHAVEWQFFETNVFGYHVVNVLFHAFASLLLVVAFSRTGLPRTAACIGGLIFLVHPANVEAVAWISQLKTTSALVLTLGALLICERRPAWGAGLFAAALLAKPTAAVALPVAIVLHWTRGAQHARSSEFVGKRDPAWRWFAIWALIFVAFAFVEFLAFSQSAGQAPALYPEWGVRLRTTIAIGLRYLVMAGTSSGMSAFHEPPAAQSLVDPWWMAALVVLGLLSWRFWIVARRREAEAAWWLFAVVSFAPICGVIPLPYPMADRYLYFILPGLLGGVLFMCVELQQRLEASRPALARNVTANQRPLALVGIALALVFVVTFGWRGHARAAIWKTAYGLMADAERNYPDGTAAKTRQARRAALEGDIETTVAALRAAYARGYNRLDHLLGEPAYAPLRGDPRFAALLEEMAIEWRDRLGASASPSQIELRALAQAHIVLEDYERALEALERALEIGGPIDEAIESDVEQVRRALRFQKLKRTRAAS